MNQEREFGYKASELDLTKMQLHAKPSQVRDEIPTLNQYGYMKFEFEHYTQSFVEYAKQATKPVLEIGTAYGWVAHQVLATGATMVACDLSQEHLDVLVLEAPKDSLKRLYVKQGAFPTDFAFPENSFEAILMARILHFLDGATLEQGLAKVHKWLVPGGKFIANNCSIYHSSVKGKMANIFQERIKQGDQWPGIVQRHDYDSVHENFSPPFINVFYQEQLEELLPKFGFEIEEIGYFDYPSDPWPDKNMGHIGFICRKI
jgi:ubiquinone/menaquinone biosynthesis C-methylase UbiE